MSESKTQATKTPTPPPPPESQRERWLKYGTNVAVASFAVIAIALIVTWLAGKYSARLDTTASGLYSLKPQTLNVIRDNAQPIKIVSLYTSNRRDDRRRKDDTVDIDFKEVVADLLDEYRRKGKSIEVQTIDPATQGNKVDQLIEEVVRSTSAELAGHRKVVDEFNTVYQKLQALAAEEAQKLKGLGESLNDPDWVRGLAQIKDPLDRFPRVYKDLKERVDNRINEKIPDYKGAVDLIERNVDEFVEMMGQIASSFNKEKDSKDNKLPPQLKAYMGESVPRYEAMKAAAEPLQKQIDEAKKGGDPKIDQLKQSLNQSNPILVMSSGEWRVLSFDKVWVVPDDARGFTPDGKPRPRFAGEQQITSSIIALTSKKKLKVAFVRPGGPPVASGFAMMGRGLSMAEVANRLRDYNFEVLEKDLTGMWAMQARMQGSFAPPEPSDEEIKDAVWVVVNTQAGRGPMGPPASIDEKVAAHLNAGGSALVMAGPQSDTLKKSLEPWGVRIRTEAMAVHEPVRAATGSPDDMVEEAQRVPYIFISKQYGDHPLAKPVESLDAALVAMVPVEVTQKPELKQSRLLPVPQTLKIWGEMDAENRAEVSYDKNLDLAPPLWAGAAAEKPGGGSRLVVIGSDQFAGDNLVSFPDLKLLQPPTRVLVSRFPGNAELFLNSVFWLSRTEHLMALSPAAMEMPRIKEVSRGTLNFWRIGVLLIGLPLAVVASGVGVYLKRRD